MSVSTEGSSSAALGRPGVRNLALLATIALPAFAIVASLGLTAAAYWHGDPQLPESYHWEGAPLDRDFVAARRAVELNVSAWLDFLPHSGTCRVVMTGAASAAPMLMLTLTHGARPQWDQQVQLLRRDGIYEGPCHALQAGHWRVDLADEPVTWRLRREFSGSSMAMALSGRAD